MIGTKIFATRTGEYVVFWSSVEPLRRKVSKATRVFPRIRYEYVPHGNTYKRVKKTTVETLVIKQVFYLGGKIVRTCKFTTYSYVTRGLKLKALEKDGIVDVTNMYSTIKGRL